MTAPVKLKNPKWYCENLLYIRDKKQQLVRLKFKPAQENLYQIIKEEHEAGRPVRIIVLKGRQEGISTVTEGLMFQDAATRPMVGTLIMAHQDDAAKNLFNMNKLFYDCLPQYAQPMRKLSNAKELVFENPTRSKKEKRNRPGLRSSVRCVTAGSKGVGRSLTLTNLHLSELAFWPGDQKATFAGVVQAVPDSPDTMIIIESTANGYEYFKELWDGAENGENIWRPVFLPWYMEPEYRRDVEPGTVWTEKELEIQRQYGLDEQQLAWRRWCIKANFGGDEMLFRQEYPNTPDEAFLLSGDAFFDKEQIMLLRRSVPKPLRVGEFSYAEQEIEGGAPRDWKFTEREKGYIRIYAAPEKGVPYVLGGDTAGEGSDYFTCHVIDNRTGRQVAELQQPLSEIYYARQVYCLGRYYNDALIALEINYSTYPEMKLEEWNYPKLYQRERFDTFTGKLVKAFGWATTPQTRPVALANLHTVMEESPESIQSFALLGEMLTFIYGKNRKPEAAPGEHDDLVLAAAICHMARSQQRYTVETEQTGKRKWAPDQWEDWRAADAETKKLLEKRWG